MSLPEKTEARELDGNSALKEFRAEFFHGTPECIYLDGNSLGRLPLKTISRMERAVKGEWGERLIRGWNEGWYTMPEKLSAQLAPVIDAEAAEVLITGTVSLNLYKLADAALRMKSGRSTIVTDSLNFPSDIYILEGLVRNHGGHHSLRIAGSRDGISVSYDDLFELITEDTALVVLSLVAFKSAFMYDMKKVNEYARSKGALVIWDLSHAAGAVPCRLNESGAGMAVGCTYKYLNGGPGAPGYLYIRQDLLPELEPPIQGWFGHADPFAFSLSYKPAQGIRKFMTGTPPVLSLIPLEISLEMISRAGINQIRKQSKALCGFLVSLSEKYLYPLGFSAGFPQNENERGSHISLRHPEGYRICKALIQGLGGEVIIPDFREPDNIRFGISPLYNTHEELVVTVENLVKIISERLYEQIPLQKDAVT
ncbi:MAG: Kynureninase [Ignavibacteriaceae bacterium]|nr:Kynureninase [Ignavibacteriaceae bacterium]